MSDNDATAIHYVCTLAEGAALLAQQQEFYLRTCGCRARHAGNHEDNNRCLWFSTNYLEDYAFSERISADAATSLLQAASDEGLVIRPFRDFQQRTDVAGICLCCACCCSYFHDTPREACDKGALIESTREDLCTDCGLCVPTCRFGARTLEETLTIDRDHCYGCGLCEGACPTGAIAMGNR